jgi:hypothetical protein
VAIRLALFIRRRPLVLVALSVAATLLGAALGLHYHGHGPVVGLWDGPV